MRLITCTTALATAACLSFAVPVAADPIQITSGSLVYTGPPGADISVEMSGAGFAFSGTTRAFSIWFSPYESCLVPECLAGSTLDLRTAGAGPTYVSSTATYDGEVYGGLGGILSVADIYTQWTGSLLIPEGFTGGTLTAPFAFSGYFQYTNDNFMTINKVGLFGSGTATVTFGRYNPQVDPNALLTQAVRFDFADVAPTPEPASMLLVATGVVGLLARRRHQRRIAP
jgi:hypothetical protein